jgi:hypothetical protein
LPLSSPPRSPPHLGYLYDFGDCWKHEAKVEKVILEPDHGLHYPLCTAGSRACPPEDCGGDQGYVDLLA